MEKELKVTEYCMKTVVQNTMHVYFSMHISQVHVTVWDSIVEGRRQLIYMNTLYTNTVLFIQIQCVHVRDEK